jgi:Domain of unknown function (DUF1844)
MEQEPTMGPDKKKTDRDLSSLPPLDFASFVLSLGSSVLLHLGEAPNPMTNEMEKNIPLARHTIDIIEMLEEKTRGNLTESETKVINDLLYDLRIQYVKVVG